MRSVVKNPDIRERYFSTPLAVSSAAQSLREGWGAKGRAQERLHHSDSPYAKGKNVKRAKERKEIGRRGRRRVQGFMARRQTAGRSASPTTTSKRAAKEAVDGCMHAGFAWIPRAQCTSTLTTRSD